MSAINTVLLLVFISASSCLLGESSDKNYRKVFRTVMYLEKKGKNYITLPPSSIESPTSLANAPLPGESVEGQFHQGAAFTAQLISFDQFRQLNKVWSDRGLWIFFFSNPEHEVQSGHLAPVIKSTLFNRMGDLEGSQAVTSANFEPFSQNRSPFVFAQFFELSENSTSRLLQFFNDRTWRYYHSDFPDCRRVFTSMPIAFPDPHDRPENCSLFSLSFYLPFWQEKFPEITTIGQEMGLGRISESPARQMNFNLEAASYRGSFFIHTQPESFKSKLLSSEFPDTVHGRQLLLAGPLCIKKK